MVMVTIRWVIYEWPHYSSGSICDMPNSFFSFGGYKCRDFGFSMDFHFKNARRAFSTVWKIRNEKPVWERSWKFQTVSSTYKSQNELTGGDFLLLWEESLPFFPHHGQPVILLSWAGQEGEKSPLPLPLPLCHQDFFWPSETGVPKHLSAWDFFLDYSTTLHLMGKDVFLPAVYSSIASSLGPKSKCALSGIPHNLTVDFGLPNWPGLMIVSAV